MDGFVKILNDRGLKESSIKTYTTNLKKLLADLGMNYDGDNFIKKNKANILALLETKGKSVRKNYLSVMLIILSPVRRQPPPENKAIYDELNGLLLGLNEKYNEQLATKSLSVKEEDNFITWADIVKKRDELLSKLLNEYPPSTDPTKLSKAEKLLIQDLVILSIYTFNPPRRLIYSKCKVMTDKGLSEKSESELDNLVALVFKGSVPQFFHFGKNAVKSKTKKNVRVGVSGATFKQLLKLWRKVNNTGNLLYNQSYGKITENYLTQALGRIFKKVYGKNISVVMLRKIFLSTNQFATGTLEEIAEQMNHSVATQQAVYTKRVVKGTTPLNPPATKEQVVAPATKEQETKAGSEGGVEETKAGEPSPPPKRKVVFKKKVLSAYEKEQRGYKRIQRRDEITNLARNNLLRKRSKLVREANRGVENLRRIEADLEGEEKKVALRKQRGIQRKLRAEIRNVENSIEGYYPHKRPAERTLMEAEDERSQSIRKTNYNVPLKKKDLKSYASNVKLWELTPLGDGWLFIDRDTKKIFYTKTREGASLFQEWGKWNGAERQLEEKVNADPTQFKVGKKRKYLMNQKWKGITDKKI